MRPRRRLRAIGLGLVLAAVLLELVLQVVSYVAWQNQVHHERPAGRVLLCIGDSLTFGLGATPEQAYPMQLQERLAGQGLSWSVVNAGIPGQSSADVLNRLPDLLAQLRPEAVCLLVGWNDTWARPAPLDAANLEANGFPLRWRTARLLSLLSAREDPLARTDEMPFLGAWHVEDHAFYFAADGSARIGPLAATWTVDGDVLHVTPEGGKTFALRWRMADRALEFALFGWNRFHRARRGPPSDVVDVQHVRDMLQRGELDAAVAALNAAGEGVGSQAMRAEVCVALRDAGRTGEARALFVRLREAWEANRDPVAGEAVAQWLVRSEEPAQAVEIARDVLRTHDDRVHCWRVIVDTCRLEKRPELAARLAAAAARQADPWRRAELTLERAVALAPLDAQAAVDTLVIARDLGIGPDESIAAMVRAVAQGADRDQLLRAVAHTELPANVRTALDRDMRRATIDETQMLAVLERHLGIAISMCRAAESQVFLLGYPFAVPRHEELVRRVAGEQGVPFVSMVGTFEATLAGASRSDWFVDPIHCTARGYELMARVAAERLGDMLR